MRTCLETLTSLFRAAQHVELSSQNVDRLLTALEQAFKAPGIPGAALVRVLPAAMAGEQRLRA